VYFPAYRPRRLREREGLRGLVAETRLSVDDLILPIFVVHGKHRREEVSSMPGVFRLSVDELVKDLNEVRQLDIPGIILFGIPKKKDPQGSEAYDADGIVQRAVRAIKDRDDSIIVITDICLCQYTDHGHCGVVGKRGEVMNDVTLELLAEVAVSHAEAGCDVVSPSDMMDGRVRAIRHALDEEGYTHIPIMAYAAKYASAFYGPFRDAARSSPAFGDRRSYQMDPRNLQEAIREVRLDIEEGADIIMVKPALSYLDVIYRTKQETGYPIAAYSVSGEFSMIQAAADREWLDKREVTLEILTSIKRAGADFILTYAAKDVARWIGR
jgi:porphobilinogen synthase